jgi:hypothetical protein
MEEYVDYLKGEKSECELEDMHVSVSVYKEVLNTYLSFFDAAESIVTNKVGIVTAGSDNLVKLPDLQSYGMMKPAVHIMVGNKEMTNGKKNLLML